MKVGKKQFLVVGLGRFGNSLATTLARLGHEVLAIDKDETRVQEISEVVTHTVALDSTDETALKAVGINNFDVAVVGIGKDIQSSIMTTLLLKEMGIKYIVAKANNDVQEKVLLKVGADKVIKPEREMGIKLANNLISSNILDSIELSSEHSITEFLAPDPWLGKSLEKLDLRKRYGINVVAVRRNHDVHVSPGPGFELIRDDVVVAIAGNNLAELKDLITV